MTLPLLRLAAIGVLLAVFVFVARRELVPLLRTLGRVRSYLLVAFFALLLVAQVMEFHRDLYPAVAWTMYTERPLFRDAWEIRAVRASGEERFPFRAVVPFDARRPVAARILGLASRWDRHPEPPGRNEAEADLREALAGLGTAVNHRTPGDPIHSVRLLRCELPRTGASSRDEVSCRVALEVEVPGSLPP